MVHIIKLVGKDNALFQNLTRQFKSAKLTVIFIALKLCATQIAEIQSFWHSLCSRHNYNVITFLVDAKQCKRLLISQKRVYHYHFYLVVLGMKLISLHFGLQRCAKSQQKCVSNNWWLPLMDSPCEGHRKPKRCTIRIYHHNWFGSWKP